MDADFDADVRLLIKEFPRVYQKRIHMVKLLIQEEERLIQVDEKEIEYFEYIEAKKMADIEFQVLLMEQKEINERISELSLELEAIQIKIYDAEAALSPELERERMTAVPYTYDEKELADLTQMFRYRSFHGLKRQLALIQKSLTDLEK